MFTGRGSPRIPSCYHPSIVPLYQSCLHTKGYCYCSGLLWSGRHAMSLYLPWMTQSTSECRFITCSCCPSSVPLCRWHWKDLRTITPPMPFHSCTWSWVLLWRCRWYLLRRLGFCGWKPIIYTCSCRGVRLNCISFIIPIKNFQQLLTVSELPSLNVDSFPNRFRKFPLTPLLGEIRNQSKLSCPKLRSYVLWWSLK